MGSLPIPQGTQHCPRKAFVESEYSARNPKQLQYQVQQKGVTVQEASLQVTSPGAVDGRSITESMTTTYMPLGIAGGDFFSPLFNAVVPDGHR